MPRFTFSVRVSGLRRTRTYHITAYGSTARFGDRHLRMGDRVQIEGAYLRRSRIGEADVRAETIRHVGSPAPIQHVSMPVRFIPTRPPIARAAADVRPMPHTQDEHTRSSDAMIDDALAAAMM